MAVSPRKVKNKRDANGSLTGRAGTVYDVNIKYTSPDGKKSTYSKKGFLTRKEAEGQAASPHLRRNRQGAAAADRQGLPSRVGRKLRPRELAAQHLRRLQAHDCKLHRAVHRQRTLKPAVRADR